MKTEPVVTIASITAAVAAVLGLLVAFGIDLSDDQKAAVLGAVAVLAPLVAAIFQRAHVTPVRKPATTRRRKRTTS